MVSLNVVATWADQLNASGRFTSSTSMREQKKGDRSKSGEGAAIVRRTGRTAVPASSDAGTLRPYDQWYAASRFTNL